MSSRKLRKSILVVLTMAGSLAAALPMLITPAFAQAYPPDTKNPKTTKSGGTPLESQSLKQAPSDPSKAKNAQSLKQAPSDPSKAKTTQNLKQAPSDPSKAKNVKNADGSVTKY